MAAGLLLTRLMKLLHLPNVTGFLIAGIIVGPHCLRWVSGTVLQDFSLITTVALGFIAFSIGGEFKMSNIKQIGGRVIVITCFEAFCAVGFVIGALFVTQLIMPKNTPTPFILLMGACAAATAPAATLMVIRQYKARGPITETLLPVVAFDDAIALMCFSVCLSLAKVIATGGQLTVMTAFVYPLLEIVMSLAIGGGLGALLALSMRLFRSRANRLSLMIAFNLAGVALSELLDLSSLMTCMMLGAVFANMRKDSTVILEGCERWTPPIFMLFFVISGASLDLSIIPYVGVVGLVYVVFRCVGKYIGALAGASIVKCEPNVKKYLGIALFPQAGVAIGMSQTVATIPELAEYAPKVVTVVLCATLIYELVGPILTKVVLTKAGEIEKGQPLPLFNIFKKKKATP